MRFFWKFLIDAYEREDATALQKEDAAKAICELHKELRDGELEADESDKVLRMCIAEIRRYADANEEIVAFRVKKSVMAEVVSDCIGYMDENFVHRLIHDEVFFNWMYDGIMNTDDMEHSEFFSVLTSLVQAASSPDLVSLVVRHFHQLQAVIAHIVNRKAKYHVYYLGELAQVNVISGVLATMGGLFRDWCTEWWSKECAHRINEYDYLVCAQRTMCEMILHLLESSLDSPTTLYDLLGAGALRVSSHFARIPSRGRIRATDHHADVFRRVLAIWPKWAQQFRKWTIDGEMGNPVADLGRSIPPKPDRPGCGYIFGDALTE